VRSCDLEIFGFLAAGALAVAVFLMTGLPLVTALSFCIGLFLVVDGLLSGFKIIVLMGLSLLCVGVVFLAGP